MIPVEADNIITPIVDLKLYNYSRVENCFLTVGSRRLSREFIFVWENKLSKGGG